MSHDALATSSQYPLGHPVLPYSVFPKSLGALPLQTLEIFPRIHIGQAGAFCAGPIIPVPGKKAAQLCHRK